LVLKKKINELDGIRPITIKEVAETVSKLIGGVKIEYKEARTGDFKGKIASNKKALKELGWEPKVELEEGISRYIEWYQS